MVGEYQTWDFPHGFSKKKTEDGLDVTGILKEMDWR